LNGLTTLRIAEEEMSNKHWLASYGERIPAEINADAYRSVLEMFEQAMQRFADKPAIRCFDQTLTYADTDRLSRNFSAYLQSKLRRRLGWPAGERALLTSPVR
jgi:long-chain acyl-CoA synthetase